MKLDITQIDTKLQCIQAELDQLARAICSRVDIHEHQILRVQIINLGAVRADLERLAGKEES